MYTIEGVSSVANFITAYEESQQKRDSSVLIHSVFFVSKGNLFFYIYATDHSKAVVLLLAVLCGVL